MYTYVDKNKNGGKWSKSDFEDGQRFFLTIFDIYYYTNIL